MAGKGFTVKKDWDNPIEHPMPDNARVPTEMRVGSVAVRPATVLAPMAGVTDTVFRRFIRHASMFTASAHANESIEAAVTNAQSGCGLLMTEFTSADGLARMRETKRRRYLTFYDDEHPIGAQIFGSNPATLADAARDSLYAEFVTGLRNEAGVHVNQQVLQQILDLSGAGQ